MQAGKLCVQTCVSACADGFNVLRAQALRHTLQQKYYSTMCSVSFANVFDLGGLRGGESINYPGCSVGRSKRI